MKHQRGQANPTGVVKEYIFRLGVKLTSTTLVVILTFPTIAFTISAQTKKSVGQPPQLPSATGSPSGVAKIYEGDRRAESFSLSYSNYDRDPGKIDDTDSTRQSNIRFSERILTASNSLVGDFFRVFSDPTQRGSALINGSVDTSRLYASVGFSRAINAPDSNDYDQLTGYPRVFRLGVTFTFGDDSYSSVTLANSELKSNNSAAPDPATVDALESKDGNLRGFAFLVSSTFEKPVSNVGSNSLSSGDDSRGDFTIRGYSIRSLESRASTTSSTFNLEGSQQATMERTKTNFLMPGVYKSTVFKSLSIPSSNVITTSIPIHAPMNRFFLQGNEFAIRGYNIRSIGPVGSMMFPTFDSNRSPQTTTQGDKEYFVAKGLVASKVFGSFTPPSPDSTQIINFSEESSRDRTTINYEQAGNYYYSKGEYEKALSYYTQGLTMMRQSGDQSGKARILMNVGVVYRALGESTKALDSFSKAALTNLGTSETNEDPLLLYNIALASLDVGETSKALSNFDRVASQPTSSETTDVRKNILRGLALNGMGSVYASLGDTSEALTHFNRALELLKQSHDSNGEAITLNNIGKLHNTLGDYDNALDYLNEALLIRERLSDRRGQADTLYDIGNVYANQDKTAESATNYERSLTLFRAINDRLGESLGLKGLGRVYALSASSKYQKALDCYLASIAIAEALNNKRAIAATLTDMGRLYKNQGELQKALASYSRSLDLTRELGDKTNEAVELYEMSLINRDLSNLDQARKLIETGIEIVESQRAKVPGAKLRSTYSASMQMCYGLYIDLLVRSHIKNPSEGFDAKAFQASEHARARSLLDLLAEGHGDVRNGVDTGLLERERSAQQALNTAIAKQTRLLRKPHSEDEKTAIAKEVELSVREYQKVESLINSQSPRYDSLTTARPLTLKEIQAQVLDENTLLLSYVLGNERSFLFAVTNKSLDLYILPKRTVIETEALKAYELLADRPQTSENNTRGQPEIGLRNPKGSFQEANQHLSQMLLAPVARSLGRKRLLIVTEGALQIVPFAALPISHGGLTRNDEDQQPLIVDHEIVSLPSASVLALLRKGAASRKPPPKTIAMFADPVFAASDARIKPTSQTPKAGETKYDFDRLISSRWEADQIAALVPRSESLLATGFAASRKTAISPELSQYRIVHFATHGTMNEEQPELSSIVLSLFDEEGKAQNGFLRLSEIYDMNLPVDLVVLSGCRTGLGKEMPGEGLRSVTQGFMYAGASRVVFSLWAVDDRVTAELMVRFYRKMLSEGLPAAEALRETQVEMWKDNRWSSPYFWAPFVLQGEF